MKNIIKKIMNFFIEEKVVEEVVEKTPLELKREEVEEQFGRLKKSHEEYPFQAYNQMYGTQKGDRIDEVLDGIARGTFVVERMRAKTLEAQEEEFKEKLYAAIRELIETHYGNETMKLRKENEELKRRVDLKEEIKKDNVDKRKVVSV